MCISNLYESASKQEVDQWIKSKDQGQMKVKDKCIGNKLAFQIYSQICFSKFVFILIVTLSRVPNEPIVMI